MRTTVSEVLSKLLRENGADIKVVAKNEDGEIIEYPIISYYLDENNDLCLRIEDD